MFSFWVLFFFFSCVFFYFGYKISERNKLALHTRTAYFAPPCYLNHKQKLSDRSAVEGCSACSRTKLYENLWPQYFIFTDLQIWLVYYNERNPPQKKHFSWYLFTRLYFFGIFLCVFVKKNVAFEQQSSENAVKHQNLTFLKMSPIHIHLISSSYNFF